MAKTKTGLGYSRLTDKIYLGKQNQEKGLWIGDKEDITSSFLNVMFQYVPSGKSRTISGDTSQYIFLNVQKDKDSIEKAIKFLKESFKNKPKK